jgi:hypothetical protein
MKTGSVQSLRNLWGDGGSLFAGRRKTAGSAINEGEGRPNQRNYGGCEPRILLFRVPDLGILRKMADDVRRRSVIWEISVNDVKLTVGHRFFATRFGGRYVVQNR